MSNCLNFKGRDIKLYTANEAMRVVLDGFDTDTLKVIDVVSGNMIENCQDDDKWEEYIEEMDAAVPGDVKIIEKADISDRKLSKEADSRTFVKMLLRYMNKNKKKVFVVSDDHEDLLSVKDKLDGYGSGMTVKGMSLSELTGRSEDVILNEINAMDPDCILSVMPSPKQEEFICTNRPYINGRIWLGCGCFFTEETITKRKKLWNFFKRM